MKTTSGGEPNPFRLEKDNKNFFLELAKAGTQNAFEEIASQTIAQKMNRTSPGQSRLKNLNNEIEELARRKEEMLFKDSQMDYVFKNQRPAIKLNEFVDEKDKKFRVRTVLKEKRQTLHEFLEKKKEIFLSKMNINIKKQQTNKLQDYIRDQKATLRARQLYFKNDVEFMNKFITDIKAQSQKAQSQAQAEIKTQQSLTAELTYLETEIERKENLISKAKDDFQTLESYKHFLDKFLNFSNSTWKPYKRQQKKQAMFITQGQHKLPEQQPKSLIMFSPENLLDIFNQIEENNIGQIQNRHDTEAQLQKVKAIQREMTETVAKAENQYAERFRVLQKSVAEHMKTNHRLKQMKKNYRNKIKITDNEDLDLEKIGAKIIDIYKDINPKFKPQDANKGPDSKELKKCMTEIQQEVIRLRQQITKEKQLNPSKNEEIQKEIKQNYKKQSLLRKQQESKQIQEKKQAEQSKKKGQANQNIQKGRKDMAKVLLQKKAVKKKVQVIDDSNKDDKYFKADDSQEQS